MPKILHMHKSVEAQAVLTGRLTLRQTACKYVSFAVRAYSLMHTQKNTVFRPHFLYRLYFNKVCIAGNAVCHTSGNNNMVAFFK